MSWRVEVADCVEWLAGQDAESVDAVVCDPPYGLEFMGHDWDRLSGQPGYVERGRITDRPARGGSLSAYVGAGGRGVNSYQAGRPMQEFHEAWAREALRVLKPGGHLLAFGGSRTYHRLVCAIEDAGFEIRDTIAWLYGSGFPKSRNLEGDWEGWGTALKPAHEPVVVARKPLVGTVAANVLEHGTGAINVDGCRVGYEAGGSLASNPSLRESIAGGNGGHVIATESERRFSEPHNAGRWPANVVLSHADDCVHVGSRRVRADGHFPSSRPASGYGSGVPDSNGGGLKGQEDLAERRFDGELVEVWACVPGCPVRELDRQSGNARSAGMYEKGAREQGAKAGAASIPIDGLTSSMYADEGGASRFFYVAKAGRAERNAGLDGFDLRRSVDDDWVSESRKDAPGGGRPSPQGNHHPTVKPIELMRWLVRLVTPPGGLVVDPFAGSGTTGIAAVLEGFDFIGVEQRDEYAAIARARIAFWAEHPTELPVDVALEAESRRRTVRESGQMGLLD